MGASDIASSVHFDFYTEEEIRRISVKRITKADLLDSRGIPVPDGLYDPEMGPLRDTDPCKHCGQVSSGCHGHFGHIEFAKPIYNPALFGKLQKLLQVTCFNCHRLKASEEKIKLYCSKAELIAKGDITGAKELESSLWNEIFMCSEDKSVVDGNVGDGSNFHTLRQNTWTSLQYRLALLSRTEIMSDKTKKCSHCLMRSPTIKCPFYGWLNKVVGASASRANAISGYDKDADGSGQEQQGETITSLEEETLKLEKQLKSGSQKRLLDKSLRKTLSSMDSGQKYLLATEVEVILKGLWKKEARFCNLMCDIQQNSMNRCQSERGYEKFFLKCLLVPPNRFRPQSGSGTVRVVEHPQNYLLSKVQECNNALWNQIKTDPNDVSGKWMDLQRSVNVLFDSSKGSGKIERESNGIRQNLEKKEGILRQKMMGKRVNQACRSVISPDPYLAVNEIGIPASFASKLTYPERVTPWNSKMLRETLIKGADEHPGATHFKDGDKMIKLPPSKSKRYALAKKLLASKGDSSQIHSSPISETEDKVVMRHLRNGDVVLVNRQPSLHKPSMMAHIVRVIYGENTKTIRMHYANCNTYNADFDGDEMNVHVPQDDLSRAEAVSFVNANMQYIVPTSGDPIRGLIQDHIVSAVLLTKLDTFLTRDEYNQLLYHSLVSSSGGSQASQYTGRVTLISCNNDIEIPRPAIEKPAALWTGKQVILAIFNHITKGRPPFTVEQKGRIPNEYLPNHALNISEKFADGTPVRILGDASERILYVHENELLKGTIDKAQFGKYGIVHTVYELYGADAAGKLLYIFSRLFTLFLQMHGFTCGVDDLLVHDEANKQRKIILGNSEIRSEEVHKKFTQSEENISDPLKLQVDVEKVIRHNGESATVTLDRMMSSSLNALTSEVNKTLFPGGLEKPFPNNCLSLMTTTGAKGGLVNMTQISSLLGQQELEGKRVPRMVSGKTLPSFPPWDTSSRAGGFIADRFLTGLRPQEYYFHCMAGREGLVDTAVKTSRSGYLQRCLIKNLESLKIAYDYTVRDVDGSVIQFLYGEDGVDVLKTSFLTRFKELDANREAVLDRLHGGTDFTEHNSYLSSAPLSLVEKVDDFVDSLKVSKRRAKKAKQDIMKLATLKYFSSLADPGEAVGVIAAQSIGEPSTQMTLNTFHLAGRGEMNVTLGIPRLQEIIMTASDKIRTPVMKCPLRAETTREKAEEIASSLRKIYVADIVEYMEVCTVPFCVQGNLVCTVYKLKMKLYAQERYPQHSNLELRECHEILRQVFVGAMEDAIQKHLDLLRNISGIQSVAGKADTGGEGGTEDNDVNGEVDGGSDADDETGEDLGADAEKRKQQMNDEMEYDDDIEKERLARKQAADQMDYGDTLEDEAIGSGEQDELQSDHESGIDQVDAAGCASDGESAMDICKEPTTPDNRRTSLKLESHVKDISPAEDNRSKSEGEKSAKPEETEHMTKSSIAKESALRQHKKRKGKERCIKVEINGLDFEVHFALHGEPHILLAEIAQKTAKSIHVRASKNIEKCSVAEPEVNGGPPSLQTSGVNFKAFWDFEDDLDIRNIMSNDIHAILNTYGVEAARAAIIQEIQGVFKAYGIQVNIRHLSLIADFMTFNGEYRPMSRLGMGSFGISPFGKMTFETATNFIIDSAFHGEVDLLESPSASICLGQPVKMGTGCFGLMQNLNVGLTYPEVQ